MKKSEIQQIIREEYENIRDEFDVQNDVRRKLGKPLNELTWHSGYEDFPKKVKDVAMKYAKADGTAISILSPHRMGLRPTAPNDLVWKYVWELIRFKAGLSPHPPGRFNLSKGLFKQTGHNVSFATDKDKEVKKIIKAFEKQSKRLLPKLGIDPKKAVTEWHGMV